MAWEAGLNNNASLADAVRAELESWTPDQLAEAIANDKYERLFPFTRLDDKALWERRHRAFNRWVAEAIDRPLDVLIDNCMERAIRTDTTDNGGFEVWIDKGGLSKVRVS
jgi:hypothetical protein